MMCPTSVNFTLLNKYDCSSKINFTGKLEENDGATMFFIAKKLQKTILNFSLDLLVVVLTG